MLSLAVTGGISCGKSTVCRFFAELGAYVVSADEIVHQLLSPTTNLGQQVIQLIGLDIVVNNHIDRSIVAQRVFQNSELLRSLERILHPKVGQELNRLYQMVKQEGNFPLFVAEIPLLFDKPVFFEYDYSLAVVAEEKTCEERFQKATGSNQKQYQARRIHQLNPQEKAKQADFVITNNGTLQELRTAVAQLFNELTIRS